MYVYVQLGAKKGREASWRRCGVPWAVGALSVSHHWPLYLLLYLTCKVMDSVYNEPILFLTLKIQNLPRLRSARFRRKD